MRQNAGRQWGIRRNSQEFRFFAASALWLRGAQLRPDQPPQPAGPDGWGGGKIDGRDEPFAEIEIASADELAEHLARVRLVPHECDALGRLLVDRFQKCRQIDAAGPKVRGELRGLL